MPQAAIDRHRSKKLLRVDHLWITLWSNALRMITMPILVKLKISFWGNKNKGMIKRDKNNNPVMYHSV